MNAFVYVNGALAGKCPFGYSTFYVPLNNHLKYGEENEIRVIVRNGAMTNSRWYSGGGIYRDVYLMVADLAHIIPEGTRIATEEIENDYAVTSISTTIRNRYHTTEKLMLETRIQDEEGLEILRETVPFSLYEQESRTISRRIAIENPKLWSDESPVLYTCIEKLYHNEIIIDESRNTFGIRKLQLDAKRGLRVNGKTVKLRGACIHHDSGLLGAATYEDSQFRQIRLLKEAGFNAIRMAHHPMAQSMLRACDELGVYVMDEAFDMWTRCKSDYDYGMYFQEWWEKDMEAMVKKDFNHPCVILYSLGNEIPEIGNSFGVSIGHKLCEKVKSLDDTRFTLLSINGVFAAGDAVGKIMHDISTELQGGEGTDGDVNDFMTIMDKHMDKIVLHQEITNRLEEACAVSDIAGYNYMTARYEGDARKYPNRIMVGSETYPPEIARNWEIVNNGSQVIGDFTWTGWDYIGEAGVGVPAYQWGEGGFGATYPCQLAYCGDIDITGYRRPASYYREIVFGMRKNPYITVNNPYRYGQNLIKTPWILSDSLSSWTWKDCEGKPVVIEVYAAGDEVELFCNKVSLGRKPAGKNVEYKVLFETIYTPGILTAVSYVNNQVIGKMEIRTVDDQRKLVLIPEEGNSKELIYLPIEIQDSHGTIVTEEKLTLEIKVEGKAELIGFGCADPKATYHYKEAITETFNGRALAILKKNGISQTISVIVTANNGQQESIIL